MKNAIQLYMYSIVYFSDMEDQPALAKWLDKYCKKYIYQLERAPTTGNTHFQCYVNLKVKRRPTEMWKLLNAEGFDGADCSPVSNYGKLALQSYCMKKDTRVEGPWADKPIYMGQDLIKNLKGWQQDILNLLDETPDPRKIVWLYDDIGNTGKTSLAKYMYFHYPKKVCYLTVGKAADLLNFVYKMQGRLLYFIDISRTIPNGTMNELYSAIESVKNGFFLNTKYETGMACFARPHVVVCSNHLPKTTALSRDRLVIKNMSLMSQEY